MEGIRVTVKMSLSLGGGTISEEGTASVVFAIDLGETHTGTKSYNCKSVLSCLPCACVTTRTHSPWHEKHEGEL